MSCCGQGKYPNAYTMTRDLSVTVVNAFRHALKTGEILSTEEDARNRITTCNACEFKSGVQCTKCGCYISLKTAVKVAKCPIGKW